MIKTVVHASVVPKNFGPTHYGANPLGVGKKSVLEIKPLNIRGNNRKEDIRLQECNGTHTRNTLLENKKPSVRCEREELE